MSSPNVCDPIAHRFVDRFLERRLADCDRDYFRAEKFHSRDVQRLTLHVHFAHVNNTFATETRGHGRGGNTMLARASFGDNPAFAHPLREENLAERVVDFVRASVQQIFAFEVNLWTAKPFREAFGQVKRRWTAGEIAKQDR